MLNVQPGSQPNTHRRTTPHQSRSEQIQLFSRFLFIGMVNGLYLHSHVHLPCTPTHSYYIGTYFMLSMHSTTNLLFYETALFTSIVYLLKQQTAHYPLKPNIPTQSLLLLDVVHLFKSVGLNNCHKHDRVRKQEYDEPDRVLVGESC